MQKVLITITQAVTVKNVLRTDIAQAVLADPSVALRLLVQSEERAFHYNEEFALPRTSYTAFYRVPPGVIEKIFGFLKKYTLRTKTTDLRRRMLAHDTGRYANFIGGVLLNRVCSIGPVRRAIRMLDRHLIRDPQAAELLCTEAPDLLVCTNLFDDVEISLLREAKRLGIKTVGFINSWDRLTARWTVRLLPDVMIVYNEAVKRDAMRHADMPAERIVLTGIPQYDRYITEEPEPRETFFAKKGLNPAKKLVLVAPMGATFSDSDWELIDLLHQMIDEKKEVPDAEMLVRFQPNDFLDKEEIAKRPWLIYDLPGIRLGPERGGDWDMTYADLRDLNSSLKHAAVLVTYTSSISVDAAVVGTPVINIDFLLKPVKEWLKTPTFYYGTEHHSNAVATGGFRIVKSKAELLEWLLKYLAHPELDRERRELLSREQYGPLQDGKAGERIAQAILQTLPDVLHTGAL